MPGGSVVPPCALWWHKSRNAVWWHRGFAVRSLLTGRRVENLLQAEDPEHEVVQDDVENHGKADVEGQVEDSRTTGDPLSPVLS